MAADQTLQNYDINPANNNPKSASDGSDTGPFPFWQVCSDVEANLRGFTINGEFVSYLGISGFAPVYVNGTTATLGTVDFTANWYAGRRVKAFVTAGTIFGSVATSSFSGGLMTVTFVWDSGALDSGLTDVQLAMVGPEAIPTVTPASPTVSYNGVSTGGGTVYAVTLAPVPSNLGALQGIPIFVTFPTGNTGPATLAPNGFAATPIMKWASGALAALASGDIPSGAVIMLLYDGTQFQLLSVTSTGGGGGGGLAGGYASEALSSGAADTSAFSDVSGTLNLTAPATGGPYRLVIAYYCPIANGGSDSSLDFRVTDQTNFWNFRTAFLSASKDGAQGGEEVSPVTYAAGTAVTINLQCWAGHSATIGGMSNVAGVPGYIKGWFVPSN